MAEPIYRGMIEDIIHISVEGLADWTSGSLRKHAPKWQQCCCLDCSDSEHGDGYNSHINTPMDKPFYGDMLRGARYDLMKGHDPWTTRSAGNAAPSRDSMAAR